MEKADHDARPSKKARVPVGSGGLTAFALRLTKKFAEGKNTRDKNVAFSPLSIYTTLGLVAAGARGGTLDELLALLGVSSRDEVAEFVRGLAEGALADLSSSGGPLVTFAYGVFYEKTLRMKPAYRETAVESYKAELRAVDFKKGNDETKKIIEEINKWVAEATNKLIPLILPPGSLHNGTRFVLTNAIYFKGMWENSFAEYLTNDREFYRLDGTTVRVPFMTMDGREHKLFMGSSSSHGERFKVLKLPYETTAEDNPNVDPATRYSMCIFLPDKRDGLRSMVDALEADVDSLLGHIPQWERRVDRLLLPKFKLSFFCDISKVLQSLGLREAFSGRADLFDMVEVEEGTCDDMRLDAAFHKAVVEVNEEGTEAAACTAITGRVKQSARRSVNFIADHPFVFYIVEEVSRTVIFVGHVLDPSASE